MSIAKVNSSRFSLTSNQTKVLIISLMWYLQYDSDKFYLRERFLLHLKHEKERKRGYCSRPTLDGRPTAGVHNQFTVFIWNVSCLSAYALWAKHFLSEVYLELETSVLEHKQQNESFSKIWQFKLILCQFHCFMFECDILALRCFSWDFLIIHHKCSLGLKDELIRFYFYFIKQVLILILTKILHKFLIG